jgi:hypothetical protein
VARDSAPARTVATVGTMTDAVATRDVGSLATFSLATGALPPDVRALLPVLRTALPVWHGGDAHDVRRRAHHPGNGTHQRAQRQRAPQPASHLVDRGRCVASMQGLTPAVVNSCVRVTTLDRVRRCACGQVECFRPWVRRRSSRACGYACAPRARVRRPREQRVRVRVPHIACGGSPVSLL